jgi:hypothetical protein
MSIQVGPATIMESPETLRRAWFPQVTSALA